MKVGKEIIAFYLSCVEVHIQVHAPTAELSQKLIGQLREDLILIVLRDFLKIKLLPNRSYCAILLEARQALLLILLDLLFDSVAKLLHGVKAKA